MASLFIKVKPNQIRTRRVSIELDVDKFERLAASFGFFSPEFLRSLKRAEKDYRAGRIRKIKSLRDLRK